jgi:hypothetical protein
VNTLARERFTQEFYNKYPLESTTIQTTIGPMVFKNLSFKSNHTNYDVTFGNDNVYPSRIHIVYDPQDGYYITSNQNKINLVDQESIRLVQDMLKYNQARKQNYKSDSAISGSIQESLRRAFGLSEVEFSTEEPVGESDQADTSVPVGLQIAREYGISDYINPDSVVYGGEDEDGGWSVEFSMLIPKNSVYEMKDEKEAEEYFNRQFNSKRSSGPGGDFSRSYVGNVDSRGDDWFVEVRAYGGYDI